MVSTIEPRWWKPEELAEVVGLDTEALSQLRKRGGGPPFVKFGRAVRYLNLDVLRWTAEQRSTRTGARSND